MLGLARLSVCGGVGASEGEEWGDAAGNGSSAKLALALHVAAARGPATSRGAFKSTSLIVLERGLLLLRFLFVH